MRETVEHGLRWLEKRYGPGPSDAWLLVPGDHPLLGAEIVQQLCRLSTSRTDKSIFVPVHEGKRGHPVLIRWSHVSGIRAHPRGQGIDTFLRLHEDETLEVPASVLVLADIDTPEDYDKLRTWDGHD